MRVCHGGGIAGLKACTNGCMSVLDRSYFSYQVAAGRTTSENRVEGHHVTGPAAPPFGLGVTVVQDLRYVVGRALACRCLRGRSVCLGWPGSQRSSNTRPSILADGMSWTKYQIRPPLVILYWYRSNVAPA